MTLSHDHQLLILGSESSTFVYVYRYDGANFTRNQTISGPSGNKRIFLTDDKEYLVIPNEVGGNVEVYRNDGSQFTQLQNNGSLTFSSNSPYASISSNGQLLLVSTVTQSLVFKGITEDKAVQVQSLPRSYSHAFSRNSPYVVMGYQDQADVYIYCNYDLSGKAYNPSSQQC